MTLSFEKAMGEFQPDLPMAVAYSGGADSTALLVASVRKWPGQVVAVHIHHGLQAAADQFQVHCQAQCAALKIQLLVKKVDARHARGQSPEAVARDARYQAIDDVLQCQHSQLNIQTVALAQHADDQIETLLLALSRGAGLPGLSSMGSCWQRNGLHYCRPLLKVSRADLHTWLTRQGIQFIEDPTNTDERFTRNRIRATVMPALQACFPQFRDTFARSSSHSAQAQLLLHEVAEQDLQHSGVPPSLHELQKLSQARLANLLRHWLLHAHSTVPTSAQLQELMSQISHCKTRGHQLHLKVGQGYCVRQSTELHWYNPTVLNGKT